MEDENRPQKQAMPVLRAEGLGSRDGQGATGQNLETAAGQAVATGERPLLDKVTGNRRTVFAQRFSGGKRNRKSIWAQKGPFPLGTGLSACTTIPVRVAYSVLSGPWQQSL